MQTSRGRESELKIVHYVSKTPRYPVSHPTINEKEHRHLKRFRTWTSLDLAGSFSREFWTRYAIVRALSERAIEHAVVALAALHEQYQAGRSLPFIDAGMQHPLSQCTKAISPLTKAMDSRDTWTFPDTASIAFMLFRPTFLLDRHSVERCFMGWAWAWEDAAHEDEGRIQEEIRW